MVLGLSTRPSRSLNLAHESLGRFGRNATKSAGELTDVLRDIGAVTEPDAAGTVIEALCWNSVPYGRHRGSCFIEVKPVSDTGSSPAYRIKIYYAGEAM